MAPPIRTLSTRLRSALMKPILSEALPPPSIPRNGRFGCDKSSFRISSSFATSVPTTRGFPVIAAGTAYIEASFR